MAATEPWSPKKKPGTLELVKDDQLLEASSTQNKILKVSKGLPFPFLPLYSQYTFGQGLKTALPFSKLFLAAGTTVKGSPEKVEPKQSKEEHQIVHDKEQYMFRVILDEKGKSAALCYLPTRVRGLVEFYHTEIPISHRHLGIGYRLVEEGLRWANESGTLVIPTCSFVKRHLDFVGTHRHVSVIVYSEEEVLGRLYGKDGSC